MYDSDMPAIPARAVHSLLSTVCPNASYRKWQTGGDEIVEIASVIKCKAPVQKHSLAFNHFNSIYSTLTPGMETPRGRSILGPPPFFSTSPNLKIAALQAHNMCRSAIFAECSLQNRDTEVHVINGGN